MGLQSTPPRGRQQKLRSPKHNVSNLLNYRFMSCLLTLHMLYGVDYASAFKQGS